MKIDDYQCDGQLTLEGLAEEIKPIEYGSRGCKACQWYQCDNGPNGRKSLGCSWNDKYWRKIDGVKVYPTCEMFMPVESKVPGMCANCKWANQFKYEMKEEYKQRCRWPGDSPKGAMDDPVEEPNIYCTHPKGSLNRRTAYKDCEQAGFGVGHWHRQHGWDTCDRWEEDRGDYAYWNFKEEAKKC